MHRLFDTYAKPMHPHVYDQFMAQMKQVSLNLSKVQLAHLAKLSARLQMDRSNVIRLAITRLAEQEGLLAAPQKR